MSMTFHSPACSTLPSCARRSRMGAFAASTPDKRETCRASRRSTRWPISLRLRRGRRWRRTRSSRRQSPIIRWPWTRFVTSARRLPSSSPIHASRRRTLQTQSISMSRTCLRLPIHSRRSRVTRRKCIPGVTVISSARYAAASAMWKPCLPRRITSSRRPSRYIAAAAILWNAAVSSLRPTLSPMASPSTRRRNRPTWCGAILRNILSAMNPPCE